MQANQTYKKYNLGVFILFLVVAFTLFALAINSVLQASAGKTGLFFVLFILTLLSGTYLFMAASATGHHAAEETAGTEMTASAGNEEQQTEQAGKAGEEEKAFDALTLLPSRTDSLSDFGDNLLRNMAREFNFVQGILYVRKSPQSNDYTCIAQYACFTDSKPADFRNGETLPGQAVRNKQIVAISNLPENYIPVVSGLGKGAPRELVFVPCKMNDEVVALIEFATFVPFNGIMENKLSQVAGCAAENIIKLNKEI